MEYEGRGGCAMSGKRENMIVNMAKNIAILEKLLGGYRFRNPDILVEALTHSSHPSCGFTYQRLEFLGDAALTLAISSHLFLKNPHVGPGWLSAVRAANISTEKLARIAVRHHLYRFLLHQSPDLDLVVSQFILAVNVEQSTSDSSYPAVYGGTVVRAPKVLADVVESIIGAVYVDCDFDLEITWKHVRGMLEPIITDEIHCEQPVARLHEICQKNGKALEFKNWVEGKKKKTNVFIDGHLLGFGCSEQKDIAKLNAARDALHKLWTEIQDATGHVSAMLRQ